MSGRDCVSEVSRGVGRLPINHLTGPEGGVDGRTVRCTQCSLAGLARAGRSGPVVPQRSL